MVSHTSVTNVTARGPLALHLTTRLGPVTVNGHRNLPGYVKNGSVSENSIPSSGQELHIPEEEPSNGTRPTLEEKAPPVVEEERETVMWITQVHKESAFFHRNKGYLRYSQRLFCQEDAGNIAGMLKILWVTKYFVKPKPRDEIACSTWNMLSITLEIPAFCDCFGWRAFPERSYTMCSDSQDVEVTVWSLTYGKQKWKEWH